MSTKIEWTDETWSPVRVRVRQDAAAIAEAKGYASLVRIAGKMAGRVGSHCEHVSPGCLHCYAETNNHRCLPANGTGLPYDRRSRDLVEAFVDEKMLLKPLGWKQPRKIFIENQSDIFGEWVTDEMRDRVFAVMALCPQHEFQVLTKRPAAMLAYFTDCDVVGEDAAGSIGAMRWATEAGGIFPRGKSLDRKIDEFIADAHEDLGGLDEPVSYELQPIPWPLPNVWLGVSVEDQATADERIPLLLQTPAAVRFISAEPLLGPVSLAQWTLSDAGRVCRRELGGRDLPKLDWVICGGESGAGARPMHPDWARGLRDQCTAAGVPFFFKQWGEWSVYIDRDHEDPDWRKNYSRLDKNLSFYFLNLAGGRGFHGERLCVMRRVGKKAAGNLLDGKVWQQFPAAEAKA